MAYQLIPASDPVLWNQVLDQMQQCDFYFSPSYHLIDCKEGVPMLFVSAYDHFLWAFPIIIRKIEGTEYKDATSVYGYCGLLSNQLTFSTADQEELKRDLCRFFDEYHIVSLFSRLHPLLSSTANFPLGTIVSLNKTVAIDLTQPQSVDGYSKSLRRQVKGFRAMGMEVHRGGVADIDLFLTHYYATMKRLNASSSYYFSKEYLTLFLESDDFESFFLVATLQGETIGVALFTICQDIMQYHLDGCCDQYVRYSPLKIIIDEGRKIGSSLGLRYLHLGGGYNGKENSLFDFKCRFSPHRFQFRVLNYVHNPTAYTALVSGKLESTFFPAYRANGVN